MVLCRSTLFELRVGAPGTAQLVPIPLARAAACWPLPLHTQPKSVRALKYPQMPVVDPSGLVLLSAWVGDPAGAEGCTR